MYRHQLVRALVSHFAGAAGVTKRTRVFSRPATFEKHMARRGGMTRGARAHLRAGYALTYAAFARPPVFFNLGHHADLASLADSAAHEIAHIRWPSLSHGSLFTKRVQALLNGYRCGPRGTRLPEPFR